MGSFSELAMRLAQYADAGTRVQGTRIAKAALWKVERKVNESGWGAKAEPVLIPKQAIEESVLAFSAVGRRYLEMPVCLFPRFPKETGSALIKADGWSHLKLNGFDGRDLGAFLLELMATRDGVNERPRKISIDMTYFHVRLADAIKPIEALSQCAPQLILSGLRLSTSFTHEMKNVVAWGKNIEELSIDILEDQMEEAEDFIGKLAELKNLKVLQLKLEEDCGPISEPAVEQLAALDVDTICLEGAKGTEQSACLAGLFTKARRKLEFTRMDFETGALAGVGTALAQGAGIESLSFQRCGFGDNVELASLQTGVATSTSLSHLSLIIGVPRGGIDLAKGWLTAVQQNRSLKTLVLSNKFAIQFPEELAALKAARPDLAIEFPEQVAKASHSSGASGGSVADLARQPQVEALDTGNDRVTE